MTTDIDSKQVSPEYKKQINRFWQRAAGLRSYSKVLAAYLIYMKDFFDPVELLSIEISEDTGLCYQSIRQAIDELREAGILRVTDAEDKRKKYEITI